MFNSIGHKIFSWLEKGELSYLRSKMQVGKDVDIKVGLRVTKPKSIKIGDYVSIGPDVIMQAHAPITIGDYTLIAGGVKIVTASHSMDKRGLEMRATIAKPVTIGKNCWLGAGVVILPGVSIGDGAVIGAGSVVTKDLPSDMICYGAPAKPVKPRP